MGKIHKKNYKDHWFYEIQEVIKASEKEIHLIREQLQEISKYVDFYNQRLEEEKEFLKSMDEIMGNRMNRKNEITSNLRKHKGSQRKQVKLKKNN
jgi:hypothetical protein